MGAYSSTANLNCATDNLEPVSPESICLKIPLILRKIFQHFSNNQLLRLSLVSKQWSSEARSLMAKRGGLIAHLSPILWRRKHLEILASDLRSMDAARISLCGINVELGYSECFTRPKMSWSRRKLDPKYVAILDLLKWRNLSMTIGPDWEDSRNCQGFQLVKKLFEDKCGELVEISLTLGTSLGEAFIQEYLQGHNFSSLNTLKLEGPVEGRTELNFVEEFLSRAPKLRTVHVPPSFLVPNVFEGSSVVVVPKGGLNPCHNFPDKLLGHIRLDSIRIGLGKDSPDFNVKTFNRIMPILLGNSCTTLNTITIDILLLVPLMNFGISFVNVRDLALGVQNEFFRSYDPAILEHVKAFNFTYIFPNVNKVHIADFCGHHISADQFSEFVDQGKATLRKPEPGRAVKIKHLRYNGTFEADQIQFLAQMFVDVETLSLRPYQEAGTPYGLMWNHWVNLKGLCVDEPHFIFSRKEVVNLDSLFCGILPEEVAELRKKSKEYLKAVHIVPVMPSITCCLRDLRTFGLDFTGFLGFGKEETDRTFTFSKVTHFIAFARCPCLSVTVNPEELYERCDSEVSPAVVAAQGHIYNNANCTRNGCPFPHDRFLSF